MKFSFFTSFWKTAFSAALALLMLAFGVHFICSEGVKIAEISNAVGHADHYWLYLGIVLSTAYIVLHSEMYRQSFKALGLTVSARAMTQMYLKRNFVSMFLPAGFISSQAFFSAEVARTEQVEERDVLRASAIYAIASLLSMVIVVIPALDWMLTQHILPGAAVEAFWGVSITLGGVIWASVSFARHGSAYRWCQRYVPVLTVQLDQLDWSRFQVRYFLYAILISCVVEAVGVVHVYIAIRALGANPSLIMAFSGYITVLIVLLTSPFLRGVGAVEALLALVLIHYGLSPLEAVSSAVLFRFFEFWLVLGIAALVFIFRPGNLLVRIAPSVLLFALGAVNILSALTPVLGKRMALLTDYLPLSAIHASAALTVAVGFVLLGTAIYLFKGLQTAWWLAVGLSIVSLLSHLAKGLDYEESLLALLTLGALLYQRDQYRSRTDFSMVRRSWLPALMVISTALMLGTLGFWLLDKKHFGANFTWSESAIYALQTFLLTDPVKLHPLTPFGVDFLELIHLLGGLTLLALVYMIFRPFLPHFDNEAAAHEKAVELVRAYGHSSLDYFKTYQDKQLFFSKSGQSFVAYKSTARYALALENPVAPDALTLQTSVSEFDHFCQKNGLQSIWYRIPEASAPLYRAMGKSLLPLGQEAVVNLLNFTLEGKERKSMRNTLSKMEREGYRFEVHTPALDGKLLQQLRAVSDEWLRMSGRSELTFAQGIFDEAELKHQTILTLENLEGKILAFINLIPGGAATEANFDLMRRTADAPNGTMDFLFINMFTYLKEKGFTACNLGLVPMSGMEHPSNLSENLLKLAYDRLPRFSGYKSLRFFKEKFNPVWETKYVAYNSQMDLINLPLALGKVIQP